MLIHSIGLGLVLGFVFFECTGLVAGGLIAPGYFAIAFDQPWMIAFCLAVALCTLVLVRLVACVTILYGRRRFLVSILLGFALQWTLGAFIMGLELAQGRIDVIGYVIPGLVAHEMDRQGVGLTLLALLVLSCGVRAVLYALDMLPMGFAWTGDS